MARLFQSFFLAGFEASTMRRADGRRNDLVAATRHDELAAEDYRRLLEVGISTAREGAGWHRLEPRSGTFDPAPVLGRIRAAEALGIQVIWDLCHFGWPDDADPFSAAFPDRLASFAAWFARLLRDETSAIPWYVPVNEPSFVAWAAGDVGYLNPFEHGRGDELKRQLVSASLAVAAAVRDVDPRARIMHVDPVIHIEPHAEDPTRHEASNRHEEAQFAAWDMLAGRLHDELGGAEAELDVIGVNFYDRNQWRDGGPVLGSGDAGYRPLNELLGALYRRYRRPIVIAETGAEGEARGAWLRSVCNEVEIARAAGVAVEGLCLYPVLDHPGWDDDRHVPVGMWGYADADGRRPAYEPLIDEVRRQAARFREPGRPERSGGAASDAAMVGRGSQVNAPAIVVVTDSRDPSGMGRQMLTLARGLAERRRVIVAAPDAVDARWLLDAAADAGLEVWALTDGGPSAQAESFRGLLAETSVAVVNVHAGIGWEGHAVAAVARQARAPAIVRTEHLPFMLTKPVDRERYRVGLAAVDAIIAVSGSVARSHIRAGVPERLVTTVRNGIEDVAPQLPRGAVRAAFGVPPSAPLVVGVGRMTRQKGWDLLIEAADPILRRHPETMFLIVGSGPLADVIDAEIAARWLSGRVQRTAAWDDVPALLEAADVVALPSRFEGLPLVALEAMAVARPVVGTRVAGIDETVVDGISGRLVPPEDPAALADAIVEILDEPATARRYGAAGRRRYEEAFTASRMVAETEAVYDRVAAAVVARQDAAPRPIAAGRR